MGEFMASLAGVEVCVDVCVDADELATSVCVVPSIVMFVFGKLWLAEGEGERRVRYATDLARSNKETRIGCVDRFEEGLLR